MLRLLVLLLLLLLLQHLLIALLPKLLLAVREGLVGAPVSCCVVVRLARWTDKPSMVSHEVVSHKPRGVAVQYDCLVEGGRGHTYQ